MPIEIRELTIKAVVNNGQAGQGGQADAPLLPLENGKKDNKEIVAECVEKVMEILNDQKEF